MVIMLCISVIIRRSLGADGTGELAKIVLVPQTLWVLGTVGVDLMNIYYAGKEKENLPKLVANSFWLGLGLGLTSIVLMIGFYFAFHSVLPGIDKLFGNVPRIVFFIMLLTIPPYLIGYFIESIIYGLDKILIINIKKIATQVIYFVCVYILVTNPDALMPIVDKTFNTGMNLGLWGVTYAHILMMLFLMGYSLILIRRFVKWKLFSFDWEFLVRGSKNIGLYAFGAAAATFLFFKVAIMVITYYIAYSGLVTDTDLGLYTTATQIIEKVLLIPSSIAFALLPKVTSKAWVDILSLTAKSSRHTFMITLLIVGVLCIFIRPILVFLYTDEFVNACYPFWFLAPGIICYSVGRVFGTNLIGIGKVYYAFYFSIVTLIFNLVLNILWIPKWGIAGSAAATSLAYIIQTIMLYWAMNRETKIPLSELLFYKKDDWHVYIKGFKGLFGNDIENNVK